MPITDATPPPRKVAAAKPKSSGLTGKRTEALTALGALAQVPLLTFKMYADVGALSTHWPNVATELAKLADTQPAVANIVDPLIQAGPYAGIITAVLPMALQIAVNHNRIAPGAMGTVPASSLSSQIEAGLATKELEALKVQAQAEEQSRQIKAEIARAREEFETSQAV